MILHFLLGIAGLLCIINLICHVSAFRVRNFQLGDFIVFFLFSYAFFVCLGPLFRLSQYFPAVLRILAVDTKRIVRDKTSGMHSTRQRLREGMEHQIMQQMHEAITNINEGYDTENPFINTMRKR